MQQKHRYSENYKKATFRKCIKTERRGKNDAVKKADYFSANKDTFSKNDVGQVISATWWGRAFQSDAVREKKDEEKVVVWERGRKTCNGCPVRSDMRAGGVIYGS